MRRTERRCGVASVAREKREEGKREETRKKGLRVGLNCLSHANQPGAAQSLHLLWRDWWPRVARYMARQSRHNSRRDYIGTRPRVCPMSRTSAHSATPS
jgi:hypothetical protein